MPKVLAAMNNKGGVGKTTVITNLGAYLADQGQTVLIVDADPQGNDAVVCNMTERPDFFRLVEHNAPWEDVIRPVPAERWQSAGISRRDTPLGLVSGNELTMNLPGKNRQPDYLRQRLAQLEKYFDWILIDTAPSSSMLHLLIWHAIDYLLIPTSLDLLGVNGVRKAMSQVAAINTRRSAAIRVLGIVPTRYRQNTLEHSDQLEIIQGKYGDLIWEPLKEAIDWSRALGYCRPVHGYSPNSDAGKQAMAFAERVVAEVNHAHQKQ